MKRIAAVLIGLCLIFSLAACNGQETATPERTSSSDTPESSLSASSESINSIPIPSPESVSSLNELSSSQTTEKNTSPEPENTEGVENQKILIAYFTWAENTQVADPSSVDVDATTSASVLIPGNAAKMASWIQARVGGELFSIIVTEPYSSDYDECLERAAEEKARNARPELVNHVENMEEYDVIFLGFPNWWYTVPMALHSFLEEYDFSGKTVIPFVTHGTGGLARTIQDMTADLPDSATVLEPIGVYRPDVDSSRPAIESWLEGLGY